MFNNIFKALRFVYINYCSYICVKEYNDMNKNVGEKNNRSVVKDHQAIHIKTLWHIQKLTIKGIQKFYPDLKYNTIYRIIHNRYMHLDYLIPKENEK
jgi:hypothetical protein